MKAVTTDLNNHLQGEVTTLCACWRVARQDGVVFRFTDLDRDLTFDLGDSDGEQTYKSTSSYSRTAIKSDSSMSVDNLDVLGVLSDDDIRSDELHRGLFDYATVRVFLMNYAAVEQGPLRLRSGWFGEVTLTTKGYFRTELRGLTQAFSKRIGELYSAECRADLGDHRCKLPIWPDEVERNTVYVAGDYVRFNGGNQPLGVINGGFDDGLLTGWTTLSGTPLVTADDPGLGGDRSQSGPFYLVGGVAATDFEVEQVIDFTSVLDNPSVDAGDYVLDFRAYRTQFESGDTGRLVVELLDAADAVLATPLDTGVEFITPVQWTAKSFTGFAIPALSRKVRIYFQGVYDSGTRAGAALDSITGQFRRVVGVYSDDYRDRVYRCTTGGTTSHHLGGAWPTSGGVTDGTALFTAEVGWTRALEVTWVDTTKKRKAFKVEDFGPASAFPTGWFDGGAVTWDTGDNAGKAMEVRTFTGGDGEQLFEVYLDLPFDIQVGDKGRVYPGCDKRLETCSGKFDNVLNMRAEPHVPGQDLLFDYPDAQS